MGDDTNEQQPQPGQVGPGFMVQAVPCTPLCKGMPTDDGEGVVMLVFESANGSFQFFIRPNLAIDYANELKKQARKAITGIHIAKPGSIPGLKGV